jgi:hypothetical protein
VLRREGPNSQPNGTDFQPRTRRWLWRWRKAWNPEGPRGAAAPAPGRPGQRRAGAPARESHARGRKERRTHVSAKTSKQQASKQASKQRRKGEIARRARLHRLALLPAVEHLDRHRRAAQRGDVAHAEAAAPQRAEQPQVLEAQRGLAVGAAEGRVRAAVRGRELVLHGLRFGFECGLVSNACVWGGAGGETVVCAWGRSAPRTAARGTARLVGGGAAGAGGGGRRQGGRWWAGRAAARRRAALGGRGAP